MVEKSDVFVWLEEMVRTDRVWPHGSRAERAHPTELCAWKATTRGQGRIFGGPSMGAPWGINRTTGEEKGDSFVYEATVQGKTLDVWTKKPTQTVLESASMLSPLSAPVTKVAFSPLS